MLANLLSNALKFGSAAPRSRSRVSAHPGRGPPGAQRPRDRHPAERLPHLFRRFERAVPADNYGGLGLGLYIVKSIVEALRGEVAVESAPGEGTRFTVTLPLDPHGGLLTGT